MAALPSGSVAPGQVCALVLAGGAGQRMGGLDKGLQAYRHHTLAGNAVQRLRLQSGGSPGLIAVSANRNRTNYARLNVPVWSDALPGYAGPLAGIHGALRACPQEFACLLVVPCDAPRFPLDLLSRLSSGLHDPACDLAVASALQPHTDGRVTLRLQPVFCLLRRHLVHDLDSYLNGGGRKVGVWLRSQRYCEVAFDRPGDDPEAFANANTEDELRRLDTPSR